jgi:hypothetical protein
MFARPLLFVLAAGLLAAPAGSLDLTGTWSAPKGVRCKVRSGADAGFKETDTHLSELLVSHVGSSLYVWMSPGDGAYENKFKGYAFTHPKQSSKGYGAASACSVDGKYYAGSLFIPNAQADADKGKLSLVFHGTRLSFMAECKGRFERTSAVDPLVPQSCP